MFMLQSQKSTQAFTPMKGILFQRKRCTWIACLLCSTAFSSNACLLHSSTSRFKNHHQSSIHSKGRNNAFQHTYFNVIVYLPAYVLCALLEDSSRAPHRMQTVCHEVNKKHGNTSAENMVIAWITTEKATVGPQIECQL